MEKRIEETPLERFIDELLHDVVCLDLTPELDGVANRIRVAAELLKLHNDRVISFDGVLEDMEKALLASRPKLSLVRDSDG